MSDDEVPDDEVPERTEENPLENPLEIPLEIPLDGRIFDIQWNAALEAAEDFLDELGG